MLASKSRIFRYPPTSSAQHDFYQELNDEVAREGQRQVVQTRGGAEFQATRFLNLAFYADGIVVRSPHSELCF